MQPTVNPPPAAGTNPAARLGHQASTATVESQNTGAPLTQPFNVKPATTHYLPFFEAIETFLDTSLPTLRREDALEALADSEQPQYDRELALLALDEALHSPSETIRSAAIDSLGLIPHRDAADLLLQALQDPSPKLREDAFYALLDKPERDNEALMVEALGNDHASVRQMAAEDLFEVAR